MNLTVLVIDFFQSWLGGGLGGGLVVGIFSAILIYKSSKKDRDIDWYDRAINQVKDLDKEVNTLKEKIESLNFTLQIERTEKKELQILVKKLELIIAELKEKIESHKNR